MPEDFSMKFVILRSEYFEARNSMEEESSCGLDVGMAGGFTVLKTDRFENY